MDKLKSWLSRSSAIAQMGVGLGAEVVDVVERMHGSISNKPSPFAKEADENTRGITNLVYKAVKGGFGAGHLGLRKLAEALADADDNDPTWLQVRAAINGVCGDALEQRGNPLAQPMILVDGVSADDPDTLLLFIHGLCMHQPGWFEGAHLESAKDLSQALNAKAQYLSYNTGRHISENGECLAQLLEKEAAGYKRIVVVGHSMGGLLTRSACSYAAEQDMEWLNKLSHVATLGTPHHGAPAERLGNWANGLLMLSPYTKPLSRLGNIRSAGIRDLRFGNLRHEDWLGIDDPDHFDDRRHPVSLTPHVQYLLLAGTRSETIPPNPQEAKHDLLVTVSSAWGENSDQPELALTGDNIDRVLLADTDHMQMLWSADVYAKLKAWLLEKH
ncbi:MAG: alpha/beta fold hydrolase [Gammaproteobacteria bacterium]|nr:alpha/beta fold hydrolase [Gammaproteobacteria bacterium]